MKRIREEPTAFKFRFNLHTQNCDEKFVDAADRQAPFFGEVKPLFELIFQRFIILHLIRFRESNKNSLNKLFGDS